MAGSGRYLGSAAAAGTLLFALMLAAAAAPAHAVKCGTNADGALCPDPQDCCSIYGFCGTSERFCAAKKCESGACWPGASQPEPDNPPASEDPTTACKGSCYVQARKGSTAVITCAEGRVFRKIRKAEYGSFSKKKRCLVPKSVSVGIVADLCMNQSQCSVLADDPVFGDPCPGTTLGKLLKISYRCEKGEASPRPPTRSPSPSPSRPPRSPKPSPSPRPGPTPTPSPTTEPIPDDDSSFGTWDVPPPSPDDVGLSYGCMTAMDSRKPDDGTCFALVWHHCKSDYQDPSRIPGAIRAAKRSTLQQIYGLWQGKKYVDRKDKSRAPFNVFNQPPSDWTKVCIARPDLAGKGNCKYVAKDDWRVWVKSDDPEFRDACAQLKSSGPSRLYIKTHMRSGKVQSGYTGTVGKG